MLKLQRPTNTPSKQSHRIEFKFSNFQALQVPKGWDRLYVSLICVETGKTIAKLSKALVKNGNCQWTETLSESIYISRDDSSKGYEECLVKLLVSTGSTRSSNILGELTINISNYTSSRASSAVSLPLKKCSYGTVLQVKIQRLNPRSKTRDEESRNSKDQNVYCLHTDSRSYRSDHSSDSIGKIQTDDLATTSHQLKLDCNKEESESASGTIHSFHSLTGSIGREDSLNKNGLKSEEYDSPERQDGGSISGGIQPGLVSVYDDEDSLPNQPSVNTKLYLREDYGNEAAVMRPLRMNIGSSRNLLEAAEDTIEELRAEAKMWERNARKLVIDLDISRNDFSNLSKKHVELEMELSASRAENDGLKREVDKVKLELEKLNTRNGNQEDSIIQSENLLQIREELENEIKYQQDLNHDLGQQLKRSQESNVELLSVLQELEETIEQQRNEIEDLSSLDFNFTDLEKEKRNLLIQLQQARESEKKLNADIELLEDALKEKTNELENERNSNSQTLSDYEYKISVAEEEIASLEAKLSGYVKGEYENNEDFVREMESLREKVRELEKDCTELTDENLELLFKLKDSDKTDMRKSSSFDSVASEHRGVCPSDESEVSDPKFQISNFIEVQELEKSKAEREEMHANLMKELEAQVSELQQEKSHLEQDVELASREKKISSECMENLQNDLTDLHSTLSGLQEENSELKRENEELHEKCSALVDQLNESKDRITSMLADFVVRENSLKSDLDALFKEKLDQEESLHQLLMEKTAEFENSLKSDLDALFKEKLDQEESLHQLLMEKTAEFERLQKEAENLHKERERISLEGSGEVSSLSTDKDEVQALLQEVQSEAELAKNKLERALQESEFKVQDLTDQLSALKQSHERLTADHERTLKLLAKYKRSEDKLKTDLNDLELKHTISDYEREQLTKEMGILKVQLQNMTDLEDEISMLKNELKECKLDKGKLELALKKLKAEKISLSEKIFALESAMCEFEECKRNKLCLEEKIRQMENDLTAKEALYIQNDDLKNELSEMKKANMQFQQKMYRLEEEKDECLKKAQDLEENLKFMEERNSFYNEVAHNHHFHDQVPLSGSVDNVSERRSLENEVAEGFDANNTNRSLQESHTSSGKNNNKSGGDGVVTRERYERTKSSLETELRDLKERYLEMSLKYAEVENQREDLVMKLKATRSGKRWFL